MSLVKRITPSFAAHTQENHRLLSSSTSSAFHEAFSATSRSLDDAQTKDGSTRVHSFLMSLKTMHSRNMHWCVTSRVLGAKHIIWLASNSDCFTVHSEIFYFTLSVIGSR